MIMYSFIDGRYQSLVPAGAGLVSLYCSTAWTASTGHWLFAGSALKASMAQVLLYPSILLILSSELEDVAMDVNSVLALTHSSTVLPYWKYADCHGTYSSPDIATASPWVHSGWSAWRVGSSFA